MKVFFLLVWSIICGGCANHRSYPLVLKKIELNNSIEIDTLEHFQNDSLLLVNIVKNGALGQFSTYCGFVRKFASGIVLYQVMDFEPFRVSSGYIAQVSPSNLGVVNWGWFNINDSGHVAPLPQHKELLDSLKLHYSPLYFINYNDKGTFFVYDKGKLTKTINYGNLIMQDSSIDFNKFDNEVLKLENDKLNKMPLTKAEDIFKNGRGLYFIAKPGLGVIRKVTKNSIVTNLMSYQNKDDCPSIIKIH